MSNTKPVPRGVGQTEPAALIGMITGLVTAAITLAIAYGADISDDQQAAILGMVAVLAPIIAGVVTRFRVFAPSSVQAIANDAAVSGDATIPPPPANGARPSYAARRAEAIRQYREQK